MMQRKKVGLDSEHPLCDLIQLLMFVLFFMSWFLDIIGYSLVGISTIFLEFISFPFLFFPAILSWISGIFLALKSHALVFGENHNQSSLITGGVYSLVRHPMYLGTLLLCLGFVVIIPSLVCLVVWIIFFIFFDKMVAYEENYLLKIFGQDYLDYQNRVSKWVPCI